MKKLKQLPDGAKFLLKKYGTVRYWLNRLDRKTKTATFTSVGSKRTYTRSWDTCVW